MDLHMLDLGTLVPQQPCGVSYAARHQLTDMVNHDVVFCKYFDLISYSQICWLDSIRIGSSHEAQRILIDMV